jgi:hypothetical protein
VSRVNKKCQAQNILLKNCHMLELGGGHSILFNLAVSTGHAIWSASPAVSKSFTRGEKLANAGKYALIE